MQRDFLKLRPGPIKINITAGIHEITHDVADGNATGNRRLADGGTAGAITRARLAGGLLQEL